MDVRTFDSLKASYFCSKLFQIQNKKILILNEARQCNRLGFRPLETLALSSGSDSKKPCDLQQAATPQTLHFFIFYMEMIVFLLPLKLNELLLFEEGNSLMQK